MGDPLILEILFDPVFWQKFQESLVFFLKGFVVKALPSFTEISFCPKCDNLCLERNEIDCDEESQNSICRDMCQLWYHWGWEDIREKPG